MIDDWLCEGNNCGELAELDYIDPAAIRRQTPRAIAADAATGRAGVSAICGIVRSRSERTV